MNARRVSEADDETPPDDPFAHGGEAGEILRRVDWARKPIGPVAAWPQSLRTALSICLASRYPICIIWGKDRLYLYNDAYAPIVGAKHPWALGESYITVWPEIWDSSIRPILETVERTGKASWCDNLLLVLQRSGFNEECYFSFSFAPTRVEDGSVGGVFTAITETTPQVVGERRLRTLRDLGAQAATARTSMEACSLAAQVVSQNPHDISFALFYLTEPDGKSARLALQVGIDVGSPACVPLVSLSGENSSWPFDVALRTAEPVTVEKLGERFGPLPGGPWPEPTHTALVLPLARGGQAAPHGFMVAGISPRRAVDGDYRDFLRLAANQVATEISNAEAYAEEKRRAEALAKIDRAKTAFFSNVSHEFRTPLTLMLGPLEDLLHKPAAEISDAVRGQLEITHRNSLRLLKLVNSLLDFSRIEEGRVQASYERVDLGALTAELASVFRSAIEKAGLALRVDCPPTASAVYVDRDMWEKIVFNLLSNAFKFTIAGWIEVRLTEGEGKVQLAVRDTGVGIPTEERSNIFKRFHRIENPRSRTHEGTGIGLSLAQELANLHGGAIEVASELGVGSTFTVTIPTGKAHLPADRIGGSETMAATHVAASAFTEEALRWLPDVESETAAITIDAARPSSGAATREPSSSADDERPRILVADDNADMRQYLRSLLGDKYTVELVGDGEAALAAIERCQPDLVLTDVMMPRLDGLGFLRALRDRPATRMLPVIMLSARAGQEASIDGYEAGADDYLIKPFSAPELLAKLNTHLRLSRLRAETARLIEVERKRLYELLMRTPAIVCVLRGPQHVFELANPQYVTLVGRADARMLLGKPLQEALPELVGQCYLELLSRVYSTGEPFVGQEMLVKLQRGSPAELEERYLNFVYQPTHDTDGRIDGILVHAVDVTEQVRARHQVEELARRLAEERDRSRASEQHLRAVVDTTPECVTLVATDGTVLEMNRSGLSMFEAGDPRQAVGMCAYDVIAPEDRERFRQFNEQVCAGAGGRLEFDLIGLRGTRRHMESHAVPLRLANGTTAQLALTRDITEMVLARQTVSERRAELERLVRERTAQLKQTVEQMEEFSYSVSHDLRSPTRAMCSYADALLEDYGPGLDSHARDMLCRIQRNGARMDRLIRDLLTYSRTIRADFHFEPVALDRLVPEVIGQYPELQTERADVTVEHPLPDVRGHEPSVVQALSNLLTNAVKFVAPNARPRVRVRAEESGSRVRLWIEDNGIGIAPQHQRKLFGMFERLHPDLPYEGTGIGLAIVRKAVERMNGAVGVESDGAAGSRFWIELDRA